MLYLIRHGRTDHNASGLLLGHLNPELDEKGLRQAEAVAKAIPKVDRIISSPLLRAQQTAQAIATHTNVEIETDDRWIELNYGDYDGVPLGSLEPELWRQWRTDVDFRPPNGESLRELGVRVEKAMQSLVEFEVENDPSMATVVVTHVSPLKSAVCWSMGVDDLVAWRLWVTNASITLVDLNRHGAVVRTFNDTSHLGDLHS